MDDLTRRAPAAEIDEGPAPKTARTAWTVVVLAAASYLGAVDRQIFAVLLVPIQKDLRVSDAAMGALTGSAFVLIYAFVALPLARLADRTSRRNLLSIAVAVWSAATMACGVAGNYLLLMLARIGVGAGEAALQPATMSMVGDLAPAQRRGALISLLNSGSVIGFATGGLIAGVLNDHFGWHVAMMAVGFPGLLLAALMFLTVPEPVRGAHDGAAAKQAAPLSLLQALGRCAQIRTLYPFAIGCIFFNIGFSGWLIWMPAFFMRVHHLSATAMGAVVGGVLICSMIAALIGGPLSDRLARRGPAWRIYYCCTAAAIAAPFMAAATLAPTLGASIGFLIAYALVSGGITAVSMAIYLSVAPANMRAVLTAVMNIVSVALPSGLSPILFGALNDMLKQTYGDQSLRYVMLLAPLMMILGAVTFLFSRRTLDQDVREASGAA